MKFVALTWYVDMTKDFFLEISPCANHVIFVTEFELLIKTPPFYEVNSFKIENGDCISKIFFLDHFSPSFLGQKC